MAATELQCDTAAKCFVPSTHSLRLLQTHTALSPLSAAVEGNVLLRTRLDYACFKHSLSEI